MTGSEIIIGVFSITLIDIILGGDNAIIIALASKALPPQQRKKAIIFGTIGAVVVRITLTAFVLTILKIPFLHFVGGILLIWIALRLLLEKKEVTCQAGKGLIDAIKTIILADAVMGVDNVIGIAGAARGHLGFVILGLLLSVPIIVWGSTFILKWMDRYPGIVYIGAGVLAWTAGKMITEDIIIYRVIGQYMPYFDFIIPVTALIFVLGIGLYVNKFASCKAQSLEK